MPSPDDSLSPAGRRRAHRAVVGGSSLGLNVVAFWVLHDIVGLEIPAEVAAAVGGMVAGGVAWAYSGGLYEAIRSYYEFRKSLRELDGDP